MDNIIRLYENSFRTNAHLPALTDYFSKETTTYLQMAENVARIHLLLEGAGIKKGDNIALIGKNGPKWVTTYIGIITYGAVVVPVLADFNPTDAVNIINHSDSRLLFTDDKLWESLTHCGKEFEKIEGAISLDSDKVLFEAQGSAVGTSAASLDGRFAERHPKGFSTEDIIYDTPDLDKTMIISYTSGTSGFSKGVMLTVGSISSNVNFAIHHRFHYTGSRVLALLPLAHAYGCAFDMLTPLAAGSHITLLGRTPTPAILIKAMKQVQPNLICTVPLVLEKIVRKNVFPKLEEKPLKTLVKIPVLRGLVYKKICRSMLDSFGGCCFEVNTGGAALNPEVERFLMKIRFPFTVGYGMTECGPLVSYERHEYYKAGSCGKVLPGMEARVLPSENGEAAGEICVRGINVMKGYYKNIEATTAALDGEGWLHTGDVGIIEADGTVYLKGRCKSMILSANGQNIYPEEIEAKLNALPHVAESLVYDEKGKIIALIVPDLAEMQKNGFSNADIKAQMDENLARLNTMVAPYEKVSSYILCEDEFEKTPKRSIRRYLYPKHMKRLLLA